MKKTLVSLALSAGTAVAGTGPATAQEVLPPAPTPPPPPPAPHTVAPGETLWTISRARLGVPERWSEIYAVNRNLLQSPDLVEVGQVLQIPTTPVPVPPNLLASLSGPATSRPSESNSARRGVVRARRSSGGALAGIRGCESGGNYRAVSASGKYRGAYQFDQRTWESVGGRGDPAAASPSEQDSRAAKLRSQRGSNPWPNCG